MLICLAGAFIAFLAHRKLEVRTALIYLPIVSVLALGLGLVWSLWKNNLATQARLMAFNALGLLFGLTLLMPKLEYYRPIPRFAQIIKEQASATDEVGTFFVDAPSLMFYTERKIFQVSKETDIPEMLKRLDSDGQVYFVTREDYLRTLQGRTPVPLEVIESRPLLQLRWENFIGTGNPPTLRLVLVRKGK